MPKKSLQARAKKAKREGTMPAIRDGDLGRRTGMSKHAAKKQSKVRARATIADRKVSRKKAPGEGRAAKPQADFPRPRGEPPPRTRARRRMSGTDLRAPKIGSERRLSDAGLPF
jgi:hypothetical protein